MVRSRLSWRCSPMKGWDCRMSAFCPGVLGGCASRRRSGARANSAERALLLDALIASTAYRSVVKAVDPETPFKLDELVAAGAITPDTAALFNYVLQLLVRFGGATETADGWRLVGDNDLPEFAEVWRLLLAEAPELVAELALVAAIAEELPGL